MVNCNKDCFSSGITFTQLTKGNIRIFPENLAGLVSDDDLKIPSSELSDHVGASGGKLLAWSIVDSTAHVVYEKSGKCCDYAFGLPEELLSKRVLEVSKNIFSVD